MEVGKCTNCAQTVSETDKEGITQGLRATVMGTITSVGDANTPASIGVSDISSSSLCENGTTKLPLSAETCRSGVAMPVDPTPTPTLPNFPVKETFSAIDNICVEGYVMDQFCIDLEVMFDNIHVPTLEGPWREWCSLPC